MRESNRASCLVPAVFAVTGLCLTAAPSLCESASIGPLAGLSGHWSGAGVITMSNGARESIRCKAVYAADEAGKTLTHTMRCASDSYRLEISGNVVANGGAISGAWSEATRHATGNITGRASSSDIQARIDGTGFSAELQVHFHGDRQSVSIRPSGAGVADVAVTLRKG